YSEIVNQVDLSNREVYLEDLIDLKDRLRILLGPFPNDPKPILPRNQYGQTRWDRSLAKLDEVLYIEKYDYSDSSGMGRMVQYPRSEIFKGTPVEHIFSYLENTLESILLPKTAFYWRFLTDVPLDSNIFGGIWPAILGTFYLTLGALLFSIPPGIIAAIYLTEFAKENWLIRLIRTCISTLAGVPSIVFGLFGLAFFINTIHVSSSKSVLAGSMTLAILVLPTIIRASEEAIRSVPHTYKEASLSLGASRWRAVLTVILPAALPGILTGIIISMGRAAGETAPIIFTAAVSVGKPLKLWEILSQPTPALSWNIYNLCTEHEAVDEIRHVQYGMVLTLVLLVLLLNIIAIVLRARINKKLIGKT
ncbi:MAG: phosphate ABC transporter permease PtsA, partial [Candidatus Neomarinimicrobiota bacterium]